MNMKYIYILMAIMCFTKLTSFCQTPNPSDAPITEEKVISTCEEVKAKSQLTTDCSNNGYKDLPVGIVRNIGGKDYVVAVTKGKYKRDSSFINAYFAFPFPGTTKQLAFAAESLAVTPGGIHGLNGAVLRLVSRVEVPFGDKAKLVLKNDGNNYIKIACDGIKKVHLSGDLIFDEGFIQSADQTQKTLTTSFEIDCDDPGNFIIQASLNNFILTSYPDLVFSIDQATFDFSEISNAPDMVLPPNYLLGLGAHPEIWQGFYLKNAQIEIPNFMKCETAPPILLNAGGMVIDKTGFSCSVSVSELSSDTSCSATDSNPWPITVNSFNFSILRNNLQSFGFDGNLILGDLDNQRFTYSANVSHIDGKTSYLFVLGIEDTAKYNFPMLSAILTLHPNSSISIEYADKKLLPSAMLNGSLEITKNPLKTKLVFENLSLKTVKPYVTFTSILNDDTYSQTIGGFTLSISKLEIKKPNDESLSFGFDAFVSLTSDNKYTGSVSMAIQTIRNPASKRWEFDKLIIDSIGISTNTDAISISGFLAIKKDDPVFGNGFIGHIDLSIQNVITNLSATAMFGKVNGLKYWYFDVSVLLKKGISCGMITIYGFRGGAYRYMKQNNVSKNSTQNTDYVPDPNTPLGLKAGVTLGLPDDKAFNADVLLEISFNTSGGINRVTFLGDAYFMKSIVDRKGIPITELPLFASICIDYNRTTKEFLAYVDTYINLEDGKIRGIHKDNFAGRCEFYFGPADWYVHIGTPKMPMGVTMMEMTQTSAYFMAGRLVDLPPVLPSQLSSLTKDLQPMNWSDINQGKGFAVGAQISTSAGGEKKNFYAMFTLGGGFDIVLYSFGDARCAGSTGTLGINGWYAMGQCYVWLQGSLGIKVNIRKKEKRFDVLRLGLAALLQAEFPNPTWMQGVITGEYNVMGGIFKGNVDYPFEVGKKCEMVSGNPNLADITVIGDISPANSSANIDVFSTPQVVFNMPVNVTMPVEGTDYKIVLDEFTVSSGGQNLSGNFVWNQDGTVLILKRDKILPPLSTITVTAKIHWKEKKNNVWQDATDNAGVITETKTISFTSGEAPNYIPDHNVEYCYPKQKQLNFYINQYNQGFVKLAVDQDYLFKPIDDKGKEWNFVAIFEQGTQHLESPFEYDFNSYELAFNLPNGLSAEKKYKLFLKKIPKIEISMSDNVTKTETLHKEKGEGELIVTEKQAKGEISIGEEVTIYTLQFRTSKYQTALAKWQAAKFDGNRFYVYPNSATQVLNYDLDEPFESDEISYTVGSESSWYSTFIYPVIYQNYSFDGKVSLSDIYGIPPLGAITGSVTSGAIPAFETYTNNKSMYHYEVLYEFTHVTERDFFYIRDLAYNLYINNSPMPASLYNMMNTYYKYRLWGSYMVYAKYKLPGKNIPVGNAFPMDFEIKTL